MSKSVSTLIAVFLSLLVSGCAQTTERESSRYYFLSSDSPGYIKSTSGPVLGIQPVRVAAYINTPGIALLTRDQHIRIANNHLWAERPELAITRVLHNELDRELPNFQVDNGEFGKQRTWDYSLITQIDQFHGTEAGEAIISGYWTLQNGSKVISQQRFNLRQPLPEAGYAALVSSLRGLLTELSRQQAASLQQLKPAT